MIRALLRPGALCLLAAFPATAQTTLGDWTTTRAMFAAITTGRCAVATRSPDGAALALSVLSRQKRLSEPRLELVLTEAQRALIPLPDGPVQLALRPQGQPATALDGQLQAIGGLNIFTHPFPDLDSLRAFMAAAEAGRLTVFEPRSGVLASFSTAQAGAALAWLEACDFSLGAPND